VRHRLGLDLGAAALRRADEHPAVALLLEGVDELRAQHLLEVLDVHDHALARQPGAGLGIDVRAAERKLVPAIAVLRDR
jgi:hypothetical protein